LVALALVRFQGRALFNNNEGINHMETTYIIIGTLLVLAIAALVLVVFWQSQKEVRKLRTYRDVLQSFAFAVSVAILADAATREQIKVRAIIILKQLREGK